MKPFLLILCVLALSFSGCKKCYTCNSFKNGDLTRGQKVCDKNELAYYQSKRYYIDSAYGYSITGANTSNPDTTYFQKHDTLETVCD